MAALVGAIGYFVYKVVRIYQAKEDYEHVFKVRVALPRVVPRTCSDNTALRNSR